MTSTGLLSYSNAGHCAPFLVSPSGRLRTLQTTGMPVGMLEDTRFQVVQLQLERGDKLVIYSDGFTEEVMMTTVLSLATTSVMAVEVLVLKFVSPP